MPSSASEDASVDSRPRRTGWFRVSAPGYPDYPIGPHFVAWLVLSIGGAAMFCRWPPRRATSLDEPVAS